MPKEDAIGAKRAGTSDWNNAWEAVSRLAAARDTTLHQIKRNQHADAPARVAALASEASGQRGHSIGARAGHSLAEGSSARAKSAAAPSMDADQLARAVAEIEKASAALRRAEPTLEVGVPTAPMRRHRYWSVWFLIAGVWLSATLVVAGATGAILYLFG
jgi:hypothetical protein